MPETLTIATMGPKGTYSEAAARKYAQQHDCRSPVLIFGPSEQCLAIVSDNRADLAVIPAENMVDGLIGATYDALIDCGGCVQITDVLMLPVDHVLAARGDLDETRVARIYSHPSALNQCARNLFAHLPAADLIPVGSTAEAASHVAQQKSIDAAAICSRETADTYGLRILRSNLGDYPQNHTRFLICRRGQSAASGNDTTVIAVHYGRNQPGQLYRTAGAFANRAVDLTAVHSRPYKIRPQEYILLFELVGHQDDGLVRSALADVAAQVGETGGWLLVLGSHPRRGLVS